MLLLNGPRGGVWCQRQFCGPTTILIAFLLVPCVCDKQGEIPPILYPSIYTYITHNTQRVINTVKPKLLSVF